MVSNQDSYLYVRVGKNKIQVVGHTRFTPIRVTVDDMKALFQYFNSLKEYRIMVDVEPGLCNERACIQQGLKSSMNITFI